VLDNSARGRVWLAERDGRLVGCTAIALRPGRVGQLRWVLVEPSARGMGLGRRLVETAIAFSIEAGCDRLYLETTDGLPESQSLYENLGFAVVSSETQVLWEDERPLIRMEKRLA
jgi:N-acetylglutamate synthase-like GNAT family acetyltransferase